MKIEWSDMALRTFHRHMHDQEGMHAVSLAVIALADDPTPPNAVAWGKEGDYRLRVDRYRVQYRVMTDTNVVFIGHIGRHPD